MNLLIFAAGKPMCDFQFLEHKYIWNERVGHYGYGKLKVSLKGKYSIFGYLSSHIYTRNFQL